MDILEPKIFDRSRILSGVTGVNRDAFPVTGLSLAPAEILSEEEYKLHLSYFSSEINVPVDLIKFNHQIHSDIIHYANADTIMQDGDALITNKRNLLLFVKIADCAGVLIHDTWNDAVAAVHSGWKGTKNEIVPKTIGRLRDEFGTNPETLKVYLSPMAQQKNYEVQSQFIEYFPESVVERNGKYYYSNENEIMLQLLNSGVKESSIESSGICTIENNLYHSYRRDRDASGRMAAFIMMR